MVKALVLATVASFFASVLAQGGVYDTTGTTTKTTTSTTTSAAPVGQTLWGQCGGIGWTGYTVCQPPATCVYANAYHSQCLIVTTTSTTSTTTTTTTTTAPVATQTHYGQCGGIGWTGATVCGPPYNCLVANAWFSQLTMAEIHDAYDTILILDFGSQYSHLITRRCRELKVYAELMPCTQKIKELTWKPKGIILSGSPYSVYDDGAPHVDRDVFELGVPVFGICYGLQEMAWSHGGKVGKCDHREYGFAEVDVVKAESKNPLANKLFDGLGDKFQVWMSHGDQLDSIPPEFQVIGRTSTAPFAGIAHNEKPFFGIQFHPEVTHTPKGRAVIGKFVLDICQCQASWTMESFITKEIDRIRQICGPKGRVIGAVSGGVDSSVAAKLMHEAIGDRFQAIMVDNGVLRANEANQVNDMLNKDLGVNLRVIDASDQFLGKLADVEDPEKKRKIIGNTFIEVFEAEAARMEAEAEKELAEKGGEAKGKYEWLLQGTLYPDVIESISFKGPSATIKTHHNVGGLLADMKLKLIEPLRELFKDEVRALGRLLGIPEHLVGRHPFPGPGLAIRILGPVTREQVKIAQAADTIYIEEIRKAGLYDQISQAFAVLLPVKAVGVMGDARTYEQVIALRAVQTEDFMTADWYIFPPDVLRRVSSRITNEVKGINRVVYDISSKPPATVEWL